MVLRLRAVAVACGLAAALGACSDDGVDCNLDGVTTHYGGSVSLVAKCPDAKTAPGALPASCGGAAIADVRVAAFYPFRAGECGDLQAFDVRVVTIGDRPDECILHAVPEKIVHDTGKNSGYPFRSATARIAGGSTCVLTGATGSARMTVGDGTLTLTPSDMTLSVFGVVDATTAQVSFDGRRGATDPPP